MRQGISKAGQYLAPAIITLALGACFHPSPPDGSIAPAGVYGGTVVAYPVDPMLYGYGFPNGYGSYGGYGYSPYAYGYSGYGLSPYGYPYVSGYAPVYLYRVPNHRRVSALQSGQYGLRPWGGPHRTGVLRPPTIRLPASSLMQPRLARPVPMRFQLPPLRSSAGPITPRTFSPSLRQHLPSPPPPPPRHASPRPEPSRGH